MFTALEVLNACVAQVLINPPNLDHAALINDVVIECERLKALLFNSFSKSGNVATFASVLSVTDCLPDFSGVKFIPIVVFADHATIKVKSVSHVVYASQLKKLIKSYSEIILSKEEKQRIYERITSMNVSSTYSRSAHIRSIKRRIKERGQLGMQNKCPRCGAELLLKTGKFGYFKGCCRFPSCTYTVN